MTIAITAATRGFLRGLLSVPAETAEGVIAFYAANQNISVDDLTAAMAEVKESEGAKVEAEKAKAERSAAKVEDERIRGLILAAASLEEVLPHVVYADSRKKRVWVQADGSFDTNLRASKQGNTSGKGRPKKDALTGFQSVETGEPILGGVSTFVKDLEESDSLSDTLRSALYTEGGNMRGRDKIVAALLEAEVIAPVESDSDDSAEDSEDNASE